MSATATSTTNTTRRESGTAPPRITASSADVGMPTSAAAHQGAVHLVKTGDADRVAQLAPGRLEHQAKYRSPR